MSRRGEEEEQLLKWGKEVLWAQGSHLPTCAAPGPALDSERAIQSHP